MANDLNRRQARFVEEYLIDLNATQAAIRAGYSPRSANAHAARLFANPGIRARVDEALAERSRRTGVNAERVVRELARIAFASAPDFIDPRTAELLPNASEDDKAAVQSIRVKTIPTSEGLGVEREVRLGDKLKALELLAKHLGMIAGKRAVEPGVLDAILAAVRGVD